VGRTGKPVLLKRGMMSTINELLMSAEYILSEGGRDVVLCERGIRTFETETRQHARYQRRPGAQETLAPAVFVDPSHGTGHWDLVIPMAKAAVVAGADGLLIEVHPPAPEEAFSDGAQFAETGPFPSS